MSSVSIIINTPNTTCFACFFFIRFTMNIYISQAKKKKNKHTNKRISIELSCWISHWQKWKLPKTFPRCNNCHVQYPATMSVLFSYYFFLSRLFSLLARTLFILCIQFQSFFFLIFVVMVFPFHKFACLIKSLHLHENDITLQYQWQTLVALKKNINNYVERTIKHAPPQQIIQ